MEIINKLRQFSMKIGVVLLCCLLLVMTKTTLLVNRGNSFSNKFYLLIKHKNFSKGDFVGINKLKIAYVKPKHFTKKIAGAPGDFILVKSNWIYINGVRCAPLKPKTRDGRKLTPIETQVIPERHYFVLADHKDSFDSRYREFGLVRDEYIEGKAYPLW